MFILLVFMDGQSKTKPLLQLFFVSLAVALFLASVFLSFFVANNLAGDWTLKQSIYQSQPQQPTVDLVKLKEDYRRQSVQILRSYLAQKDLSLPALAQASLKAQGELLNLILPAEDKESHLSEILLLGEIANLAESGNVASVSVKLDQLKRLVNE